MSPHGLHQDDKLNADIRVKKRTDKTEVNGLRDRICTAVGLHFSINIPHMEIHAMRRELEQNGNVVLDILYCHVRGLS